MAAYVYDDALGWVPLSGSSLPNSGVGAGTYGDATHVGQFAVNAQGIVTAAANVAIAGITGASLTLLFDSTLGGTATTIDSGAGGFSTSLSHLLIFASLRSDEAATNTNVLWQFNGDSTATNYKTQRSQISGTTQTIANIAGNAGVTGTAAGASADASVFAACIMYVVNYASTTPFKAGELNAYIPSATSANNYRINNGWLYTSTNRITRVSVNITTAGTHFIAGSRLTIYGAQ